MKNINICIANTDELVFVTNFTIVFDHTLLESRIVVHANFHCFVIYVQYAFYFHFNSIFFMLNFPEAVDENAKRFKENSTGTHVR